MGKTIVEKLYEKRDLCIENAINSESKWARNFWKQTADKIKAKIDEIELKKAEVKGV